MELIAISKGNSQQRNENSTEPRKNEEIPSWKSCRLIWEDGTQRGVYSVTQAMELAHDAGLDLVEMSSTSAPIVCKAMNYGKYKYDSQKKQKQSRKNNKQKAMKEMKFRCGIGDGDYETKKKHVLRFLDDGSKVKITIMFRGREMSHPEKGLEILDKLAEELSGLADIVQKPLMEGRNMTMVVSPTVTQKKTKQQQIEQVA